MRLKRALLVGIDSYRAFEDLSGCEADVAALTPLLQTHANGSKNFDCRTLVGSGPDAQVSAAELFQSVSELLKPGADVAMLYFAGHAANVDNELYLVTSDGSAEQPGVPVSQIFELVFRSSVPEVVVVLDCCFAGNAGQFSDRYREGALLRDGLSLLASSRAHETSAEKGGRGFFSLLLGQALEGAALDPVTGLVTLAAAHEYIARQCTAWDQQPVLKVNAVAPCELRQCRVTSPSEVAAETARRSPTRRLTVSLAGLCALIGAMVAWWLWPDPIPEVLIRCNKPDCSQDATLRCPKGQRAVGRCEMRLADGVCELGNPVTNGRLTRVHVESKRGAKCAVRCLCAD